MMNKTVNFYFSLIRIFEKLNWLPPLLSRVTIGIVFVESGWGKLHNLQKVIDFFTSLGIPAAQIQAPFVASVELGAGLLILIGFGTRIAAIPLIGVMVVAILTAKTGDISTWTDVFSLSEFLYIILLVWLIVAGAGSVSLDWVIKNRSSSPENAKS